MTRLIPQTTKTPPTLGNLLTIDTSVANMFITLVPTLSYSKNFDLYDVDGSISNIYFTSALIMSNDTSTDLTGLESNFPVLYTTTNGVEVSYIYITTVVVSHNAGATNVRIPGYQQTIYYTIDGINALSSTPNITTYNNIDYYNINCFRLCYLDTSGSSFMFSVMPPYLSYLDRTNTSIFTNAVINAVVNQNLAFNFAAFSFPSDAVAYVKTDNILEIDAKVALIGLGTSAALLTEDMLIT